jgi:hypothetical protein
MKSLPITLHLCLNAHHSSRQLQPADTHPPFHISSKHLVFQASDRLLERPSLTLESPVTVDFGPKGPIAYLTDGLVNVVVPHVVSIKEPKYVGGNRRGRSVNIHDGRGVNLAVVSRAIE